MSNASPQTISGIRRASRELVRQFGLTQQTVAGTDLSISAVHAIIEIGNENGLSAKTLGERLVLEKSTISRLLQSLIKRGEVEELRSKTDGRMKQLQLTAKGEATWADIESFAKHQVASALDHVSPQTQSTILQGLDRYAQALERCRVGAGDKARADEVAISCGYTPGLIGDVVSTLQRYMSRHFGFGSRFEARIATDLSEFMARIDDDANAIWHAHRGKQFLGSISIDSHFADQGFAHLRWFIVDDTAHGRGIGRQLLQEALAFCDRKGFAETHLWTVKGLDAARALYERSGFKLAEEYMGDQWGSRILEQKFIRPRPN